MKMIVIITFAIIGLLSSSCTAQKNILDSEIDMDLPYAFIPEYDSIITQGKILARMVDGLGYRYYWATEGIGDTVLNYKASEDSRENMGTLEHLHGLSEVIKNFFIGEPNIRPRPELNLSWEALRKETLLNIKTASDKAKSLTDEEIAQLSMVFKRGDNASAYPIWNTLNGPLADAIYHVGQIVYNRRAAGNPLDPRVNVFMGRNRE